MKILRMLLGKWSNLTSKLDVEVFLEDIRAQMMCEQHVERGQHVSEGEHRAPET